MMEKGTADITTMIIDVVTTRGMTMIKVMAATMIVVTMILVAMILVTMIAITVATAIATTTTTDALNVLEGWGDSES